MLRLLLIGEGSTELGTAYGDSPPDLSDAVAACLFNNLLQQEAKARKLQVRPYSFEIARKMTSIPTAKASVRVEKNRLRFSNSPWVRKLASIVMLTKLYGLDGVVIQQDREKSKHPSLYDARLEILKAYGSEPLPLLIVVSPCRSVETWLLCDTTTVQKLLGESPANLFSGDPEERPPPDELKDWIAGISKKRHTTWRNISVALAKNITAEAISKRCCTSYSGFSQCIAAMFS